MSGTKITFIPTSGFATNFHQTLFTQHSIATSSLVLAGLMLAWPVDPDASYFTPSTHEAERFAAVMQVLEEELPDARLHPLQQDNDTQVKHLLHEQTRDALKKLSAKKDDSESHPLPNGLTWLTLTVRRGDNLSRLFDRHQLDRHDLHRILELREAARQVRRLQPGWKVRIKHDSKGTIHELLLEAKEKQHLHATRVGNSYLSGTEKRLLKTEIRTASATVDVSLTGAAKQAGLPEALVLQLSRIFEWQIDFGKDIQPGDRFSVVYEALHFENEPVEFGSLLAAEFINAGKTYQAVKYTDPNGRTAYFTPAGDSLQRTFLQKPVANGQLSSKFSPGRSHPVLKSVRAHRGIDYRAPRGTEVYAASEGVIKFAGRQRGFGKVIEIQHGDQYSTLYAHLSKYPAHLQKGHKISQGEVIGYVGRTGLATGPHLHYELRKNGTPIDPLKADVARNITLNEQYLAAFKTESRALLARLEEARGLIKTAKR